MILIVCGVSGVGKTTTGRLLSEALGIPFFDADEFHPASNIEKMSKGIALSDKDRHPWLETLAGKLAAWQKEGGAVLACSALKESYRVILGSQCKESIIWIILYASEALLTERLAARKDHFFDQNLLASQLEALELPDYGWKFDVESSPHEIVATVLERLRGK